MTSNGGDRRYDLGKESGQRLNSLTSLRFLAALCVLITHAAVSRDNPAGLANFGWVVGRFAEFGYLGVTFFFVLSGFVLTWSAPTRNLGAWDFYRRRFARIYPLHLLTAILAGVAILATGGTVGATAWPLCLLLIQAWVPHSTTYFALNPVSWSLSCEVFFYALTPMLLGWTCRRSARTIATASGVMIVAMVAVAGVVSTFAPGRDQDVWFSPWFSVGAFTAGMALAIIIRRGWRTGPSILIASAAMLLTILMLIGLSWDGSIGRTVATVLALPAVSALIAASALRDLRGGSGWLTQSWMVRVGEWSFALYLIHKMVFSLFTDILHLTVGPALALGATMVAIAASGITFHFLERPLERWLRPVNRQLDRDVAESSPVRLPKAKLVGSLQALLVRGRK